MKTFIAFCSHLQLHSGVLLHTLVLYQTSTTCKLFINGVVIPQFKGQHSKHSYQFVVVLLLSDLEYLDHMCMDI